MITSILRELFESLIIFWTRNDLEQIIIQACWVLHILELSSYTNKFQSIIQFPHIRKRLTFCLQKEKTKDCYLFYEMKQPLFMYLVVVLIVVWLNV